MNFSMKAFIITWLLFLTLLSLTLTGAFYLAAHGSEFGSTTITQTTNSTSTVGNFSITSGPGGPVFSGGVATCSPDNAAYPCPPESSSVVSNYGRLGLILAVVLGAVIGLAVYASKKLKK